MALFDFGAGDQAAAIAAQNAAANRKEGKALTAYGNTLPDQYSALGAGFQPYQQGGATAYNSALTGLGLQGTPQDQQQFINNFANTPGYQFQFDQGMQALQRGLNANSGLYSGRAGKAFERFGQGQASTGYNDYLKTLLGIGQQGQIAVGQGANLGAQGLNAQTDLRKTAYGGNIGANNINAQGQLAQAQAAQAGIGNLLGIAGTLGGAALGGPVGSALGGYLFGGGGGTTGGSIGTTGTSNYSQYPLTGTYTLG